ncbi:LAME_0E12024g1_1 [Lachancea meyersii CBS 8951]|uniref:Asparagine--tRNA ligase, mitochondrial n=1 Tax=Lachancea meyersii CBS 8951 TaxID=1266667 RepID=A0A1G4JL84_9SACH|nr:LAME_0E12024g1_1 [Lachancea meyersii CBS 8951]
MLRLPSTTFKSLFKRASSTPDTPETVRNVQGWVKSVRVLKNLAFVDLQDGTTPHAVKLVVRRGGQAPGANQARSVLQLKTGQSVCVDSAVWTRTVGRQQLFELRASEDAVRVIGDVPATYALQKKAHSLAFLRANPVVKHRSNYLGALLRFRSQVELTLAQFMDDHDCTKVAPPVLTSGDCEGAGELFAVDSRYFGSKTYLTVSTQLHLEVLAAALNRCWTLSPCFRAETSDTNRHLAEFWMLEAELCFVDRVWDLTVFAEAMLKRVVGMCVARQNELLPLLVPAEHSDFDDAATVQERWNSLLQRKWPRITYTHAVELLTQQHATQPFQFVPNWGQDLQSEHEKWLASHFASPVFITDYPRECKAFYMKLNADKRTVACFDLIVPQMGELIGGSVREDNYDALVQEMTRRGMNAGDLEWYLALRQNGSVPHGGFGLGMERLVSWLFGAHNIRDAIPFYRTAGGSIQM